MKVEIDDTQYDLICVLADAVHDRCFGVSQLADPDMALAEISDDGGIHEAAHQLLRALPWRNSTAYRAERDGGSDG